MLALLGKNRPFHFPEVRAEADQLRGFLCPEAFAAAKVGNGLQKIGLSLGVVSHNQIDPRIKGKLGFLIISEASQCNRFQIHTWCTIR